MIIWNKYKTTLGVTTIQDRQSNITIAYDRIKKTWCDYSLYYCGHLIASLDRKQNKIVEGEN